jgi:hypothetical protein
MSASSVSLRDYVETLLDTLPHIHPAGRASIDYWIDEALDAADHGDAAGVARLALRIGRKVEMELRFQCEDAQRVGIEPPPATRVIQPIGGAEQHAEPPAKHPA